MASTDASRTILGPLTTTWTQPPSCSVAIASCSNCNGGWVAQVCASGNVVSDDVGCWPPRSDPSVPTPYPLLAWGFYSPGLICPAGYTTACSATGGGNSQWGVAFKLLPGETAVGCCPSGFFCQQGYGGSQTCLQVATATTSFPTATCISGATNQYSFVTVPASDTQSYSRLAPMIQINFQATDLPSSSSTTARATVRVDPPRKTNSADQGGLSTGAKAGIGVGAALVVIIFSVVAFLVARMARRRKAMGHGEPKHHPEQTVAIHSGPTAELHGGSAASELPTPSGGSKKGVHEMGQEPRELPA